MEMLGGGEGIKEQCRDVSIMSDSAYVILTKNSKEYTGNFAIDDEVLRDAGVKDLEQYSCVPGSKLMPDFFLDVSPEEAGVNAESKSSGSAIGAVFQQMQGLLSEDLVKDVNASYLFDLGEQDGSWYLDLKSGKGAAGQGTLDSPDCTMILNGDLFQDMFKGKANAATAFMSGKLKIKGDMGKAMKLEKLMKKMNKAKL